MQSNVNMVKSWGFGIEWEVLEEEELKGVCFMPLDPRQVPTPSSQDPAGQKHKYSKRSQTD